MAPGPCDQQKKGCCVNTANGASYCATREEERLSCDVAAPQDADTGPTCEYCGYENQPCCFPSSSDALLVTPWEAAMMPLMCNNEEDAENPLACMLDKGSADYFNRYETASCQHGGNEKHSQARFADEGEPFLQM